MEPTASDDYPRLTCLENVVARYNTGAGYNTGVGSNPTQGLHYISLPDLEGNIAPRGKFPTAVLEAIQFEELYFYQCFFGTNNSLIVPRAGQGLEVRMTEEQITLLSARLGFLRHEAGLADRLASLRLNPSEILATQAYGCHPSFRLPLALSVHLGLMTQELNLCIYSGTGESTKIWVQQNGQSSPPLKGSLNTTVARKALIPREITWDDMKKATKEQILNDREVTSHEVLGQVANVYIRREDDEGPTNTYDATTCYCYATRAEHYRPVHTIPDRSYFHAYTPGEIVDALSKGHFAPSSAVVLVYFLLKKGLVPGKDDPRNIVRFIQLELTCMNTAVQSSYPNMPLF